MSAERSIVPVASRTTTPVSAIAIANTHERMRPVSPMLTQSETAPIVQKRVFLVDRAHHEGDAEDREQNLMMDGEFHGVPLGPAGPGGFQPILRRVARRVGHAGGLETGAAQAARIAATAREAIGRRLVTRHRQRVIDAERHAAPDDLGFARRSMIGVCSVSLRPSTAAFVARFASASNARMNSGRQSG